MVLPRIGSMLLLASLLLAGCSDDAGSGPGSGGAAGNGGASGTSGSGGSANAPASGGSGGGLGGSGGGSGAGVGGVGGAAGSSTGGTSGATGAGGATVWRPFRDDSPWNTPIPPSPSIDPNSAALIADFESSSAYGEHLDVNIDGFSIPLFDADASTPKEQVSCRLGGHGFSGSNGMDATALIPIPNGAAPDPESDRHLLILDRAAELEYGMWDAANTGGNWSCGLGALLDLAGSGVRPLAKDANPWWEAHGPRACGFGLVAGLIRREEIEAGKIDHALVVAYPHIRAGFYVSPASTAQAANGAGAQKDRGIPCGGRIQLDPAIDVAALALSPAGKAVLRALQIYGAYVGDYSGAISLYADNSPAARAYWSSITFGSYELQDKIDLASFRVLEIGTMHDNGNGG